MQTVQTQDAPTFAVGAAGILAAGASIQLRGNRNNKRRKQIVITNRHGSLNLRVRVVEQVPAELANLDSQSTLARSFHAIVFSAQNFTLFTDADLVLENGNTVGEIGVGLLEIFYQ